MLNIFFYCYNLSSLTLGWNDPLVYGPAENYFYGVPLDQVTLYVPVGSKGIYTEKIGWRDFGKIVEIFEFADEETKEICVDNWDADGDGKLSAEEASAITELGEEFKGNEEISSFDELQFFTGITNIYDQSFAGCSSLASITIPDNVTSIGEQAFAGCASLTSMTVKWEDPLTVPANTFEGVPLSQATLYVPENTKAAYMSANVWKDFYEIAEENNGSEDSIIENEDETDTMTNAKKGIYTIDGQYKGTSFDKLAKGLYIVNGRKCVVK